MPNTSGDASHRFPFLLLSIAPLLCATTFSWQRDPTPPAESTS